MITVILMIAVLVLFNLVAYFWGVDSTNTIDSDEWERRRTWRMSNTR